MFVESKNSERLIDESKAGIENEYNATKKTAQYAYNTDISCDSSINRGLYLKASRSSYISGSAKVFHKSMNFAASQVTYNQNIKLFRSAFCGISFGCFTLSLG